MIKFADYFNFANIKGYNEISTNLASGHNFLATCPVNKNSSQIERHGDLFYGIKNNEPEKITVKVSLNDHVLESLDISSGQIGFLSHPLLMIKLYRNNKLTYQITNNSAKLSDSSTSTNPGYWLSNWIGQWFGLQDNHLPNQTNYNVEFIYGYLTEQIRKDIMGKKLFCLNDVDAWNQISLYGHTGHIESWLYIICYIYPEQINREFCEKYLAGQYKNEEVISQFINLNPDWVEFF
jgi:hypothetical protein